MSANSPSATPATPASTWTEPPWSGWIETTGDALLILEAARRGLIPRVTRRLVDSERKMITSGSVFVFDEDESGIKRWTDGFFWSPSRILGNFLLYRETDKRGAGHRGARAEPPPEAVNEHSQYNVDGARLEAQSLSRPKGESSAGALSLDRQRERVLVGSLTNSYKFKTDGLMKKVGPRCPPSPVFSRFSQTFSLTIRGVSQHLISYYKIEDVEQGRLRSPSSLPELASLDISPEYLDKTHFRNPPKVEIGVDGIPRYRGEADDIDQSPSMLTGPLSSGLPLLTDGRVSDGKRGRYTPYGGKKRRGKTSQSESTSPTDAQGNALPSPATPTSSQAPPPHAYPDQSPVSSHPHYASYPIPPNFYGPSGYADPPPPPHVDSPYPSASPNTPHQHQPAQPYGYPGYNNQPPADPQQQGLVPPHPQGFYPYYPPPPHPPYGGFPGTWQGYGSYPPQGPPPPGASAPSSADLGEKPSEAPAEPTSSPNTSA